MTEEEKFAKLRRDINMAIATAGLHDDAASAIDELIEARIAQAIEVVISEIGSNNI